MKSTQTDSELKEEYLLNFVVNSLDKELSLDLGENVEVTTEELDKVLAGAGGAHWSVGGSVSNCSRKQEVSRLMAVIVAIGSLVVDSTLED